MPLTPDKSGYLPFPYMPYTFLPLRLSFHRSLYLNALFKNLLLQDPDLLTSFLGNVSGRS